MARVPPPTESNQLRAREQLRRIQADRLRWSQKQLADAAGVSTSLVSMVLGGKATLTENTARRLIRVFRAQGVGDDVVAEFQDSVGIKSAQSAQVPDEDATPEDNEAAAAWHIARMEWRQAETC